jgi:hypothetical protein
MRPAPPPNTQTIGSLASYGHSLGGLCGNGHAPRNIDVDMGTLIARYGPDVLVTDIIARVVCMECGQKVAVHVCSTSPRYEARGHLF